MPLDVVSCDFLSCSLWRGLKKMALMVASVSWPHKSQCFPWLTFPLRRQTRRETSAPWQFLGSVTNLDTNPLTSMQLKDISLVQHTVVKHRCRTAARIFFMHITPRFSKKYVLMTRASLRASHFELPWLSPVALFHKSLSIWTMAHQKQEMIKWTIRGGHRVPLLWRPQIRPPALPLENRHRTQRKLLSAVLPHLPGLSHLLSLPLCLSLLLLVSLSRRWNPGLSIHNLPPYSTRIPQAKPHQATAPCHADTIFFSQIHCQMPKATVYLRRVSFVEPIINTS